MEKKIALLIADLSGYTALTETHGALAAANLIDKYIEIVRNCLVGDSHLHERTGDEIMVVSSSADSLLTTALLIAKHTSNEEYFLQVHGGMHYGTVLQRANSYFGSTINLASRIAAKAKAGRFWCSDEFVNALSNKSAFSFSSKGKQNFKNVTTEKEVFELCTGDRKTVHIDPVCRMLILEPDHAIAHPAETGTHFCSSACLHIHDQRKELSLN
jgi:class 3 adenylate cyclase